MVVDFFKKAEPVRFLRELAIRVLESSDDPVYKILLIGTVAIACVCVISATPGVLAAGIIAVCGKIFFGFITFGLIYFVIRNLLFV